MGRGMEFVVREVEAEGDVGYDVSDGGFGGSVRTPAAIIWLTALRRF